MSESRRRKQGLVGGEDDLVIVGCPADWLVSGRPGVAGLCIANVEELAPCLAGGVFAPARHIQILALAVSRPRISDHHVISRVR